jgi:hypothetical protein
VVLRVVKGDRRALALCETGTETAADFKILAVFIGHGYLPYLSIG